MIDHLQEVKVTLAYMEYPGHLSHRSIYPSPNKINYNHWCHESRVAPHGSFVKLIYQKTCVGKTGNSGIFAVPLGEDEWWTSLLSREPKTDSRHIK